jgi:hypothetical protein
MAIDLGLRHIINNIRGQNVLNPISILGYGIRQMVVMDNIDLVLQCRRGTHWHYATKI